MPLQSSGPISIGDIRSELGSLANSFSLNGAESGTYGAINQKTFLDSTPYEMVDKIGNVFNRLVIFDGGLIHSVSEYFGWDLVGYFICSFLIQKISYLNGNFQNNNNI